jgi:sensor domain CHASE-containing protein
MSLRFKSLLIAMQISALMWGVIVFAGVSIYQSTGVDVDQIATASTK